MFHRWNQTFRNAGFLARSANINPAWRWEQREGWLIWPYYVFPFIRRPDFMIITPSFSPFSIVFSNQRFSTCSPTVDVGFVKLSSNWVRKMNIEYWCTFAAVVLSFLDTILFNVRRSLSVSFGFRPLVLVAGDIFPWFVYAVMTLKTAATDTPNKVRVLVIDAPAKSAPIICPFWKSDKSPILQYFHMNCYYTYYTFIRRVTEYNL